MNTTSPPSVTYRQSELAANSSNKPLPATAWGLFLLLLLSLLLLARY
jgi:hypothetical protein